MAITLAQKKGNTIYVYDEKNKQIFTKGDGEVMGYTADTVTIKRGNTIYVYDAKGNQKFTRSA